MSDISYYSLDEKIKILKKHNRMLDYNTKILKSYEEKLEKQIPDEIKYNTSNSTIKLLKKDDNIYTFAHELGHHFSIKNNKDTSEIAADNYINILAKECLEYWELYVISIGLSVRCDGVNNNNFDLKEVKKQYKKYKKLNK